jgi:N-acyl-D-aspartate/D-glutamate deacylase
MPTFMRTHWARDRTRGPTIPLPEIVRRQTSETARTNGLLDRGALAPGYRADLNIIDFDRLGLGKPKMVWDLPAGGRRLIQDAHGYEATIVAGHVVCARGEHTGALPGRLVTGPQPRPAGA